MNNEKLMVIANGMRLDAYIDEFTKLTTINDNKHYIMPLHFNPYKNDTQFKEVLEWLLTYGIFSHLGEIGATFIFSNRMTPCVSRSNKSNATENILEIAYEVANNLISDESR